MTYHFVVTITLLPIMLIQSEDVDEPNGRITPRLLGHPPADGEFVVPLIQFFLSTSSGATMAHCEGKEPREAGEGLWARHPPEEVRSALKIVAHYYGIDPIDLEGLLDSIAPLLSADD
jgi:hypothetical protein